MPRVAKKEEPKKVSEAVAVAEPKWKGKSLAQAKLDLIAEIRVGMPSLNEIKTQGFGILRKQREWERRSAPFIAELEQIEGRPVSVERYRPGR